MKVFRDVRRWQEARRGDRRTGRSLGLVPTMGALHDGHLSLVARSLAENHATLVSIFVNPTQFDDSDDLAAYPQPRRADLACLRRANVDFVLLPSTRQLYPDRFRYRVSEQPCSRLREGAIRPGHFEGVLTIVLKLLVIADAERAYFGEKDWQQLELVRGLASAFFLRTTIVGCPTVRDEDGLALSSRNARLTDNERLKAPLFHQTLVAASSARSARARLRRLGFGVDYVDDERQRRVGAVRLGRVRLIDNVPLGSRR
jgi:pantoate--beta-alanine ligase